MELLAEENSKQLEEERRLREAAEKAAKEERILRQAAEKAAKEADKRVKEMEAQLQQKLFANKV